MSIQSMKSIILSNEKVKGFYSLFLSNIITLISSVVSGFIVPGLIGVSEYAYWQIFVLYSSYLGLFHFGFLDGLYIKNGQLDYDKLNKRRLKGHLIFLLILESVVAVLVVLFGLTIKDHVLRVTIFILAFDLVIQNINTYFSMLCQVTKRFNIYSRNTIISRAIYWSLLIFVMITQKYYAVVFMAIQLIIDVFIMINYFFNNREIILSDEFELNKKEIMSYFKIGFFIMLGNLISILTLKIGNIYVQFRFPLESFSVFSFANNTRVFITLFINSISMLFFPYLSRVFDENKLRYYFELSNKVIGVISAFALNAYFIISFLIIKFLPKYMDAVDISRYLFASQIFTAQISIVSVNYFKRLKMERKYLVYNIIGLFLSISLLLIFTLGKKTMSGIGISIFVASIIWLLISDMIFNKFFKSRFILKTISFIIISISFLIITSKNSFLNFSWLVQIALYNMVLFIVVIFCYRREIFEIIQAIKGRSNL